jgi:hypothetical protein
MGLAVPVAITTERADLDVHDVVVARAAVGHER